MSWVCPKPAFAGQALWQERREADVREHWIRSSSQVVATIREARLNVLCDTEVDERVVWIVQGWSVVNLEQSRVAVRQAEPLELQGIEVRVRRTGIAWGDLVAAVVLESHIKLSCIIQINIVEG